MAQVTESLLAEFQSRVDRGEHINSTVHEEAQLLHAFRERARDPSYAALMSRMVDLAVANGNLVSERDRAVGALGNIRTLIDGKIDVNYEGDGPNIFGQIDNECAVGLGEAP